MDFAALYLLNEPFRDLASGTDRRGTRAVSVLVGAFPIIVFYRLLAGSGDIGGVDDEALIDRQQVLTLDYELGHRGISYLILPTTRPPHASACGGQNVQASPRALSPSAASRSLQAASSVM